MNNKTISQGKNMRNLLITTTITTVLATAAVAEENTYQLAMPVLSGEVSLDFAETTSGDIGGSMGLDLGVNAMGLATVDLDFEATDDDEVTLENWEIGTSLSGIDLAVGDDLGVMPEAEGEQTLADPVMAEAVRATMGDASMAVGFTDWNSDITDVSNIQGAYTLGVAGLYVTAAADYNLNNENTVVAASVGGLEIAGISPTGFITYDFDQETVGYETVVDAYGFTTYVNGDDTDLLQNVGGEYKRSIGNATLKAGANYNVDTEDFAPTAGLAFSF